MWWGVSDVSSPERSTSLTSSDGRRRTSLYALLVALAAAASFTWMFLTPLGSVPDESSHVQYAAAVVRGQIGSGEFGRTVTIPRDVVSGTYRATCTAFAPLATTRCQVPIQPDSTPVSMEPGSAGYPPLYFAIVGLPTLAGFNETSWYLMRALSVGLGIGLLAAFIPASRRHPTAWPIVGAVLGLTPMATYMLASVNPNGVEIFAGLAASIGITFLMLAARARDGASFVQAATPTALALSYLILARPKSYLLAAGLVTVGLLVLPRGTWSIVRANARAVALRVSAPALALVAALSFEVLTRHAAEAATVPVSIGLALRSAAAQIDYWVIEMVGIFGWRDFRPPVGLAFFWLAGIGAITVIALAAARWRQRIGLVVFVVGGTVIAPTFVLLTLFRDGVGYQGRYQMPLTVGIPIVAAGILAAEYVAPGALGRRLAGWLVWGSAIVYALIWGGSVLRYAVGLPVPGPAQFAEIWAWWLNPAGTVLLVISLVGYLALVAVLSRLMGTSAAWSDEVLHDRATMN